MVSRHSLSLRGFPHYSDVISGVRLQYLLLLGALSIFEVIPMAFHFHFFFSLFPWPRRRALRIVQRVRATGPKNRYSPSCPIGKRCGENIDNLHDSARDRRLETATNIYGWDS